MNKDDLKIFSELSDLATFRGLIAIDKYDIIDAFHSVKDTLNIEFEELKNIETQNIVIDLAIVNKRLEQKGFIEMEA